MAFFSAPACTPPITMSTPAQHAILALLWSENLEEHSPSQDLTDRVTADWERFRAQCEALPDFDLDKILANPLHPDCEGDPWNQVAHDFIFTRNHHGAGFWDGRCVKPFDTLLTDLAQQFDEISCELGGDGLVHLL